MDLSEKDGFGLERRNEDHLSFHESGIPSDWRFGNPQAGLLTTNTIPACQGDQTQMGSFGCHRLWGAAIGSQNSSFGDAAVPRSPFLPPPRIDVGWNPSDAMSKGGAFSQNGSGILPPGLSQFPADSAFIERAARFSFFNDANVGSAVNPFGANGSSIPFSNAQNNEANVGEASEGVSMSAGSPLKTQRGIESIEHEFSVGGQEEAQNSDNTVGEPSFMGLGVRKRRRGMELDQAEGNNQISVGNRKENAEVKRKEEQNNSASPAAKPSGKHGKDSVDTPKEDYVHVRARRGQATNSHSLAERVRREKISERMKFLQDLVPGCSKVTGKAVMLDEIINYVQSLQRQVEFLSMKLAAVNPRLDFNIERLLSKEILQSRAVSSTTTLGFSPDMVHPQLHPTPQTLGQSGFPVIGNPSEALRRAINAQLTVMSAYREQSNQIPNTWDNELHNAVQMDFGGNAALSIQELHGLPPPGHMKAEP